VDETVGRLLRRLREVRGLSLRQLGKLVNYSHVYVWEVENGVKSPTPPFVAACDDKLCAGGQLVAAAAHSGTAGDSPTPGDFGLAFPASWQGSIDTVTTLWRHDAGRRRFLHAAVHVPAALALPVRHWTDVIIAGGDGGPPSPAAAGGQDGHPAAEAVRAATSLFRRLDNLYGGGQIRPTVVRYLDAEVAPLLRGATPGDLGPALLSAVAELTQLAGWLAYDSCEHGLAQRYFLQALHLAEGARDYTLGAGIFAAMSHQAVFIGENRLAIDLAHAARRAADRAGVPALAAEASALQAQAYAQHGDEENSTAALSGAEAALAHADRTGDPQWLGYFGEPYLAAVSGHCFRALGHQRQAERCARRSLDMDAGYTRGRLFNYLLLAGSHVLARDIDQTCAAGHHALDLAGQVSSARATVYIGRLTRDLEPWRTDARVKELTERSRTVIAQA
jgi:hypothetical protein